MNRYLSAIQKLAKIGKVLSKIVFIFSLIGGIACAVGLPLLALIPDKTEILGITIHGLTDISSAVRESTAYIYMSKGLLICAGEAVISKFAEHYFRNEIKAGTPFTYSGGRELCRLGIISICISVGVSCLAAVASLSLSLSNVSDIEMSSILPSVGLGICFIIMSVVFKYGSTLTEHDDKKTADAR